MPGRAVALVGATASGKSALAMEAARRTGVVEIISVDSMTVYREMDLATAKASPAERAEVPHHLIDVLDPSEECSVALFQALARSAIADVLSRGRVPLLVGGTGLYHRAVIDELEIPGQFPELRLELEARADEPGGAAALYGRLVELDPPAAAKIEPGNARRIVRALEVLEGTGRRFSSFGPGLEAYPSSAVRQVGLRVGPGVVAARIEERIEAWRDAGLLDEVRALSARPAGLSRTARQAIGYRELLGVVEDGADLEAAFAETVARSRAFARRQRAWFQRDPRVSWESEPSAGLERLIDEVERIAADLEVRD